MSNFILTTLGQLCILLGVIGIVVPLLPTTPFLLIGTALLAKSNKRIHNWLSNSRLFGSAIREWGASGTVTMPTKVKAIILVTLSIGIGIASVPSVAIKTLLTVVYIAAFSVIVSLPMKRSAATQGS